MRLGTLTLRHKRLALSPTLPPGPRILTLYVHLELGVTGGTVLSPRVATLPFAHRTATMPFYKTVATLPYWKVAADIPDKARTTTMPTRETDVGDTEWLPSPGNQLLLLPFYPSPTSYP